MTDEYIASDAPLERVQMQTIQGMRLVVHLARLPRHLVDHVMVRCSRE